MVGSVDRATTDPADRFWSVVRYHVWKSLSADDPAALRTSLEKTCRHERIPMDALIPLLEDRLWRPPPTATDGAPGPLRRRCLLAAAAGTRRGLPVGGAVRCVRMLLLLPHTTEEVDTAIKLCSRDAATRGEVIGILLRARAGETPSASSDRCGAMLFRRCDPVMVGITAAGLADALRRN